MRKAIITYIAFFSSIICLFSTDVLAQELNGFNNSAAYISAYFLRESQIIESDATFFNVVVVKNPSDVRREVFLDVNLPIGWSLVATETRSYWVEPGDSVLIPVRAAPSKGVEGEIGYSVIAAINNRQGETLTNAYSFVKIPRKSDIRIRPLTRLSMFDQQTDEADFSLQISNQGNISEIIFLVFESSRNVTIQNERDNKFAVDVLVKARSDTTLTFIAARNQEVNQRNGNLYRVDLRATTQDRVFNTSFWFDRLESTYRFNIPESEKILVAEFAAQNILSTRQAYLVGGIRGAILLNKQRSFLYNIYKFGTEPDFFKFSRIRLEYNTPSFKLFGGDIYGSDVKYGFGKGLILNLPIKDDFNTIFTFGRNPFRPINNYGFNFEERATTLTLSPGYTFSDNQFSNSAAHGFTLGSNLKLGSNHSIKAKLGASTVRFNDADATETGYSFFVDYFGTINKTNISIREHFSSTNHYGNFAGRHDFSGRINQPLNERTMVDLIVNDRTYRPVIETNLGTESDKFQINTNAKLIFRNALNLNLNVYGGPVYERKSTNSFFFYDQINPFSSHSAKLNFGIRVRDGLGTSFNPSATFGYSFITSHSIPPPLLVRPSLISMDEFNIFNAQININLRRDYWGVYLNYFYGPSSINQEISQFYYGIGANSIRIMPFIDRYIYRDILKLSLKPSLLHDFAFKTTRVIINSQLDAYLKNDYTISLLNTYSHQKTTDLLTENSYTYATNYFEIRLKKEFNWNQPRIKYYNLELQLFKDLNGSLTKDLNEPGVKDILVTLTSIDPNLYNQYDTDYEPQGAMVATRLVTGIDGKITYSNLARGIYKVELRNIGTDQSKFFPDQNEFTFNFSGNQTIKVPYLERNKIFGRVILNRSRISTLGRIEPSNIKITATDSKGRQMSTLSDANGNFEMYVPSVDSYVVTINDIFRDHFTLRQNNFRANLNGFKQFEVNFVFDEIRRQIEFTPSQADIQTEIRRVGRTNLTGFVRDASTLQALRAQVEVIDNATGRMVQSTSTDRNTGRYTATFVTGEDYSIVVSANGYWISSERLILDQFLTIQDAERDVLLEGITIGARFKLNNLSYSANSSQINTEAIPELDRLISQLRQNPNVRIKIEGHSDATETLTNGNLSMQRAETIMRYMVQNGFSNIEFTGLRDSRPLAPNDTEDNRRRNRRVEIVVIDR